MLKLQIKFDIIRIKMETNYENSKEKSKNTTKIKRKYARISFIKEY